MSTHITFVLDSSGSMSKIEDDTKGGFNSFLREQREEDGDATVTLYEFNSTVELVYQDRGVTAAPTLDADNYRPGGKTALHDAIARAVTETGDSLEGRVSAERPETVIVVVLTDGKENASETPVETVRQRVEQRTDADDWEFLFIGANQDAALTAESMGVDRDRALTMDHSSEGTQAAYDAVSRTVSETRRTGSTEGFTEEEREEQRKRR